MYRFLFSPKPHTRPTSRRTPYQIGRALFFSAVKWAGYHNSPPPSAQIKKKKSVLHSLPHTEGANQFRAPCHRKIKFCAEAPNVFSIITVVITLYTQKRDEPSRKGQMTMRFTGHYRTGGPQNGTVFPSPFWLPEFGGGTSI